MKAIKAVRMNAENFKPFGRYYNLFEEKKIDCADAEYIYLSNENVMTQNMHIGITECRPGDFDSISMERHTNTEEPQFCGTGDMVLTVADTNPFENPEEDAVRAFIMKYGDVAVVNKCIYHDANHAIDKKVGYYFLADDDDDPRNLTWYEIKPEPVHVVVTEDGAE